MSLSRKKPHCHTCGSPMEGHKRRNGSMVCPGSSNHQQQIGGGGEIVPAPLSRNGTRRITEAEVNELARTIPSRGYWHRRNPNWVDPDPPPRRLQRSETGGISRNGSLDSRRSGSRASTACASSVVSTELADSSYLVIPNRDGGYVGADSDDEEDGGSIAASATLSMTTTDDDDEDDKASVSSFGSTASDRSISSSFLDRMLASSEPLASMFATPTHIIPSLRCAADKYGLHVGVVRSPNGGTYNNSCYNYNYDEDEGKGKGKGVARSTSWWVVMGRNAQAVKHLLDIHRNNNVNSTNNNQREIMPGTLSFSDSLDPKGSSMTMIAQKPYAPNLASEYGAQAFAKRRTGTGMGLGFIQLLLASVMGGIVVLYGLSLL